MFAATDCLNEEKVGVMKCGDLDLPRFSFSILAGDCRVWYPNEEFKRRLRLLEACAVMSDKAPIGIH